MQNTIIRSNYLHTSSGQDTLFYKTFQSYGDQRGRSDLQQIRDNKRDDTPGQHSPDAYRSGILYVKKHIPAVPKA